MIIFFEKFLKCSKTYNKHIKYLSLLGRGGVVAEAVILMTEVQQVQLMKYMGLSKWCLLNLYICP